MSFGLGKRRLTGLGAVLATVLLLPAGHAQAADPLTNSGATVDQPGALLVFPKVVFSQGRDTIIQIANTFNTTAQVRCFYIDARLTNPESPPSAHNLRVWQETDFSLFLTRQQPTHWVASLGRPVDPSDPLGSQNAGMDPGGIPPVTAGFEGELRCVVVDPADNPLPGANWLKGEATIRTEDRDVSDYNAIAFRAGDLAGQTGNTLQLDEVGNDTGGQYNSCPDTLLLDFFAFGQNDPVVEALGDCGTGCPVETTLTLTPCSADLESVTGASVTVNIDITNEFEQTLSRDGVAVNCWLDSPLNELGTNAFDAGTLGSTTGFARITPADGQGGVLGIAEETRFDSGLHQARAAFNLHHEGTRANPVSGAPVIDTIVLSAP